MKNKFSRRFWSGRFNENIALVAASVRKKIGTSIRCSEKLKVAL